MKTSRSPKKWLAAAVVLAASAGAAFAATGYVVPWEVNPTLTARIGIDDADGKSVTAFEPGSFDLSADGEWLVFTTASGSDGARNVMAFRTSSLASLTGGGVVNADIAGASSLLWGEASSPIALATGGGLDATLALDPAAGVARILPNAGATYRTWTRRHSPKAVVVSGNGFAAVAAADLLPDGEGVVSADATGGTLALWTLSGTADALTISQTETTWATGLDTVSSPAVYAVGKPTAEKRVCAVVGEANGDAATVGQIRLVNLETGAATTLLTDAERFGAGIASVRMSRTDTYRPRLYVLTKAGDLHCHWLSEDLSTVTATYSHSNAELLAVARAPFADAAESARVCAFDVSSDGGTLVFAYRAVGEAEPTEAMTLAVVRHTPRPWRFYEAGEEGNPSTAGDACISDGRWALRYEGSSAISLGAGSQSVATSGNAYANACGDEFLDLSFGYVSNLTANTRSEIAKNLQYALGTNANCRVPRVILHSPFLNDFTDKTKGWVGIEELVIDSTRLTTIGKWSGFDATMKRFVLNCPNLASMGQNALDNNNGTIAPTCDESDAETDWIAPGLKTLDKKAMGRSARRGRLDLPNVVTVGVNAIHLCPNMTEVRLSEERRCLASLGGEAMCDGGSLRKVTLGGVDGFTFGNNVFRGQPLEEVRFTGGVPKFAAGMTLAFPDTAAKTMRFCIPRGHAGWAAVLEGHVTPLTEAERREIWLADPDRPLPFGIVDASVFLTKFEQYVCYDDERAGVTARIDFNGFFGDAVETESDLSPASDGSYLPGTTLTLAPKPSATGSFVRWYGDVPRENATNAVLTLVLTNDVWLYARFVHPWRLSDDRTTASDGNFTVNCVVRDATARTLCLGKPELSGLFADADEGQDVLDLGGEILDGDGNRWTFQTWGDSMGLLVRRKCGKGDATTFLSPGTITGYWERQYLNANEGESSYRTFILDEPSMPGRWVDWCANRQNRLTRMILQTPRLTAFGNSAGFWGVPLTETKFDWWDLSGLTDAGTGAFAGYKNGGESWDSCAPASGVLRLPSLRTVRDRNADGKKFSLGRLPNAEGFVLGGLTKNQTVTYVGESAFAECPKLKTLTIHNAMNMVVGATPFKNGVTPGEIVFTGRGIADGGAAFSNLLAGVTAAETKPVVIYVSSQMPGWNDCDYIDRDVTDAERAQLPDAKVLGVYRGGVAAPFGKALVVKRKSPFDPLGFYIILR